MKSEELVGAKSEEVRSEEVSPEAQLDEGKGSGLNRRQFLGASGATLGATLAVGATGLVASSETLGIGGAVEAEELGPLSPVQRRNQAYHLRQQAAIQEKQRPVISHVCNGDETNYSNRIGNFHKSLPHAANGEVDPTAYDAMLDAVEAGTFAAWEAVPAGSPGARLLNPLGGLSYNLDGPDTAALAVNAPPSVDSAELAAQAAELYWMALLRDHNFADWNMDPLVQEAADSLDQYPGYTGPKDPNTGTVTPQVLFRVDFPGVLDGPIVSQFLLRAFFYDAIQVVPQMRVAVPDSDFMTDYNEWLTVQDGGPNGGFFPPLDPVSRFPRNPRDLGLLAGLDRIYSVYFRALLQLQAFIPFFTHPGLDANHPYQNSVRQGGFATFGLAHIAEIVGAVERRESHTWYQKWQVHRFLRPEAYGGLVHRVVADGASYPIHPDLLNDTNLLQKVFDDNKARNIAQGLSGDGTYLLSQLFRTGSPTHPSFPAGHAISAGAAVTALKAFYNEDFLFPAPRKVSDDGLTLTPYVAGPDGPPLTLGGELNKLAHNLSFGRDMSGVHWRVDDIEGLRQGEALAIRWLREQKATYPEPFVGFELTKFDGTQIIV